MTGSLSDGFSETERWNSSTEVLDYILEFLARRGKSFTIEREVASKLNLSERDLARALILLKEIELIKLEDERGSIRIHQKLGQIMELGAYDYS